LHIFRGFVVPFAYFCPIPYPNSHAVNLVRPQNLSYNLASLCYLQYKAEENRMAATQPHFTPEVSTREIARIKLWFNAFIPRDVDGAQPVPAGEYAGETMFPTPGPIDAWFLTDNRGFSTVIDAKTRMHSEIEIDTVAGTILREHQCCDPSTRIDSKTGEVKCHEPADTSNMNFSDFTVSADKRLITVKLRASTKNPCLKVAGIKITPNQDYSGTITIQLAHSRQTASIVFEGEIETFPAYEMYVSVNDGPPFTLFQEAVVPGSSPALLVGPPTRQIRHEVEVKS
jgi:hypothetical protein